MIQTCFNSINKDSLELIFSFNQREILRDQLLQWFEINGRHWIPWKLDNDGSSPSKDQKIDPYKIWIAEVMLQQTQVKVVIPYWERWMNTFPTLDDLANAEEQQVLLLWQGLGYYSRARRIHQSSKILMKSICDISPLNSCSWPKNLEDWIALPGIGRTTAGSILSSAFNSPTPILDGNVKRVYSRLLALYSPIERNIPKLWNFSELLLDQDRPRDFNQALMDLGATICTVRDPNCFSCPWNINCIAFLTNQPTKFPVKEPKRKLLFQVIGVGVIFNANGEVLIDQRLNEGLLGGLWEFPGGKKEEDELIQETIHREIREELDIDVEIGNKLITVDHSYSHKKLQFQVYLCKWIGGKPKPIESQQIKWVLPSELSKYPFPAANKKIIDALIKYLKDAKTINFY